MNTTGILRGPGCIDPFLINFFNPGFAYSQFICPALPAIDFQYFGQSSNLRIFGEYENDPSVTVVPIADGDYCMKLPSALASNMPQVHMLFYNVFVIICFNTMLTWSY